MRQSPAWQPRCAACSTGNSGIFGGHGRDRRGNVALRRGRPRTAARARPTHRAAPRAAERSKPCGNRGLGEFEKAGFTARLPANSARAVPSPETRRAPPARASRAPPASRPALGGIGDSRHRSCDTGHRLARCDGRQRRAHRSKSHCRPTADTPATDCCRPRASEPSPAGRRQAGRVILSSVADSKNPRSSASRPPQANGPRLVYIYLTMTVGSRAGVSFLLDPTEENRIGRDPECTDRPRRSALLAGARHRRARARCLAHSRRRQPQRHLRQRSENRRSGAGRRPQRAHRLDRVRVPPHRAAADRRLASRQPADAKPSSRTSRSSARAFEPEALAALADTRAGARTAAALSVQHQAVGLRIARRSGAARRSNC